MSDAESLQRLSKIFRDAAARSTGDARPKFQRLSKAFDRFSKTIYAREQVFNAAKKEYNEAFTDLRNYVQTADTETQQIFDDMIEKILADPGIKDAPPAADKRPPKKEDKAPPKKEDKKPPPPKKPGHFKI